MFFYHSDHLGSSSFITDAAGDAIQHLQYLPFGESFVDERHSSPYYTPYKFSGKEKDDETGFSYFGARYYDGDLSVWLSVDPMSDKYPSLSCYMYCGGNPVVLVDPDGMSVGTPSTHTDEDGNVIAVYNDGDNSVYKHDNINNKTELDKVYNSENTSAGGTKMGETEYWDEFVSPETGNTLTNNKIQFGKSFDPILAKLHLKAEDMNLKNIASESGSGGLFDVKKTYKNVGALLNGKYATSRSAGNFLAGYNAEGATLLGISISFETFQKLAGALHVCESQGIKFTVCRKTDILLNGTTYGNPPAYGEEIYQYRMSKNGWNKAQFYGNK